MDNNDLDLRVVRTKGAIRKALVELMNEKEFEKITVKDITVKAKINRGTFYTHYQDKFDLMKKCQEEIIEEMTHIAKDNFLGLTYEKDQATKTTLPLNGAVIIFKYIKENSQFMKAMLGQQGDLAFQITVKDFLWKNLFGDQRGLLIEEKELLVPEYYLISYIASAHLGVIQQWLNSGMRESPEEMANILSTITVKGPLGASGLKNTLLNNIEKDD